jgi:translation elongation factor EF-G
MGALNVVDMTVITIRSLTGERGIHYKSLSHYEKMPKDYQKKVIQETQEAEDE